jgi:RNA ligase (TIGR02306 family)
MSTFTVPLVTVKSVTKHPNADALDILTFDEIGWQCVDKKDARRPGDHVVYVPIDSVVKVSRPEFAFLAPKAKKDGSCRIRTIRLRGEISQGLVLSMPEDLTPWILKRGTQGNPNFVGIVDILGADVAEYFEIIKYEPPPESKPPQAAGNYPGWCEKSDAERFQNFNRNIEPYAAELFYKTLKMDGTSVTVFYDNGVFGVCSRNWEVKEFDEGANKWTDVLQRPKDTNIYWKIAREYGLLEKTEKIAKELNIKRVAVQGEICGPGIQGNKMSFLKQEFFAFDIYNGDTSDFVQYSLFFQLCHMCDIRTVRLLELSTIEEEVATGFAKVNTLQYSNGTPAEGVVYVAANNQRVGNLGRLKFKFINPEFLLKYE